MVITCVFCVLVTGISLAASAVAGINRLEGCWATDRPASSYALRFIWPRICALQHSHCDNICISEHTHTCAAGSCSGQISLLPSAGWEMSGSLRPTGWRPSVADWGGGMSAGYRPQVQLFTDMVNGWPHNVPRYHKLMPISCDYRDCNVILVTSLTRVGSAVASTAPSAVCLF